MVYKKEDAIMTRGLAIISMVTLHLFCRKGVDVVCSPIFWISNDKPLVYWFGFFSEICVPLYSICAGYARVIVDSHSSTYKHNLDRIFKLLLNYWIVLIFFSGLGLVFDKHGIIPGSLMTFLKNIVLIHRYNGAWWYLNTYIILLLIPTSILLFPVERISFGTGLLGCLGLDVVRYLINRFDILPVIQNEKIVFAFIAKEFLNLLHVLPYFWAGAFLCKAHVFDVCDEFLSRKFSKKKRNYVLLTTVFVIFVVVNILEKAVLMGMVAVLVFLIFNLLQKPLLIRKIFVFLGRHSTNIWLIHMFFYAVLFRDLVWKAKYPIFIWAFMFLLCISCSWAINLVYHILLKHTGKRE